MTASVELAHIYRAEVEHDGLDGWGARLERDLAAVPCGEVYGPLLVFVDDYPGEYTPAEREDLAARLSSIATKAGVALDLVAFESSCATVADRLGHFLPHSEWWVTENGKGRRTATLIKQEQEGLWTCPALAAIWTLARLGVTPYYEAVIGDAIRFTEGEIVADTVLTVLPVQYIGNEAAVIDILRQLRSPRVKLSRVQYVFT